MMDKEKIELALKHIRSPFFFVDLDEREREAVRFASRGINIEHVISRKLNIAPKTAYLDLNKAIKKINEEMHTDITLKDLPDALLKLVEEVLNGSDRGN